MSTEQTVLGMWRALSARDWDRVKTYLAPDCIYADMPLGPAAAARGPEDIVKRLKVGLEPLAGYENHDGVLVIDGADAMYEHSETWTWTTGETAVLPFVTVHRLVDGKITLWKDYWDMGSMTRLAPPNWIADFATADMSWVYDATGQI
ncbi:nuclear transport factor 2 family protein [Mycobacterium sp. AMU20-3851]|uniref:nuclear transport factor 2 family protein n=1 Tax=Mycobacterium sp. AMU20-3851 TaxID=3122055 RepID=UPI0037551A4F